MRPRRPKASTRPIDRDAEQLETPSPIGERGIDDELLVNGSSPSMVRRNSSGAPVDHAWGVQAVGSSTRSASTSSNRTVPEALLRSGSWPRADSSPKNASVTDGGARPATPGQAVTLAFM